VFFFVLFLLFLPTLFSVIKGFGDGLLGIHFSWQTWLILILVVLIGLRVFIDCTFRKR
jgi:hypothetical protein